MEITSLTNAKVKQWAKYKEKKYREKDQRFLVEGRMPYAAIPRCRIW